MRNLSIVIQIAIINILVFSIFISIFIYKNYSIVSNQLVLLQNEKIDSIIKTITPIISINLTLGLEDNIKEIVNESIKLHKELIGIEVINNGNEVIYKNINSDIKNAKMYNIILEDTIIKSKIGELKVFYTFSSIYSKLLSEFYQFLAFMAIFFILSLLISSFLIKQNLKPLIKLKESMKNYSLHKNNTLKEDNFKNEISVINNSAIKMIKKIEEELEKRILYEKEIMQKNRLASMGEMLDNIAHQWRQPLMKINAIVLNTDRSIELKKYDEKYLQDRLNDISQAVFYMSNTIDTFREFLNPLKIKHIFEIKQTIEKSINVLNTLLKDVDINITEKEIYLDAYESEFMQVIISILSNSIEIFKEREIKEKSININIYENDNNYLINIEDNAGGIKNEIIDKIFEPYFTTKHKSGGTGMGLYISKLIMQTSFKGDIKVQNKDDRAIFILEIPKGKEF
ncbi:sensor histidine kinase [Aliarcobacter cibarius]|uniref:histidine kinase n=2 Tax=Aliarcobacter cibarius TaxID=255507 RepID=A0A7L5JMR8_9BACT|nr:HAMP domain-containing sensor histidine kinase [Aliarcobacter cibarius]QKJ26268.1 two-component system sensor histidine kinase [Aliarcobacter cibarius]TLT02729.1 HAMP domain-containing histidine kinase [Aliarcobacter cibarius]